MSPKVVINTHDTYAAARVRIAGGTGGPMSFRPISGPNNNLDGASESDLQEIYLKPTTSVPGAAVYGQYTAHLQGLTKMSRIINSRMQQMCWVQKSSRAWPRWAVYQIRFYAHDVVEIYLKPITSVPGDAFAAPGTDAIGFRWIFSSFFDKEIYVNGCQTDGCSPCFAKTDFKLSYN